MNERKLLEILNWALGDDTGSSSEALCRWMLNLEPNAHGNTPPYNASDRGRCIRLLNLVPEWWDRLDELAELPSRKVNVYSSNGLEVKEQGWKEQIPLIRQEAALSEKEEV